MTKNKDLFQILIIVIIGMFIPFIGSITINFGLNLGSLDNILKIVVTFSYFLLIFAIELLVVYFYFKITNIYANRKIKKYKPNK